MASAYDLARLSGFLFPQMVMAWWVWLSCFQRWMVSPDQVFWRVLMSPASAVVGWSQVSGVLPVGVRR